MKKVDVGDPAPELSMSTHTGKQLSLADYRGEHPVVVFFYPKDGTAVCTKEACSFRDAYQDFTEAGAVVIGISSDSAARHQSFSEKHGLPFLLVSDQDGNARRAFGVPKTMGVFPGRVTYVIDREGIVRHIFSSQFAADRHVQEALDVVRKLKS
jgi:peroxiredoxin Q/BCP